MSHLQRLNKVNELKIFIFAKVPVDQVSPDQGTVADQQAYNIPLLIVASPIVGPLFVPIE